MKTGFQIGAPTFCVHLDINFKLFYTVLKILMICSPGMNSRKFFYWFTFSG